MAGKTTAVDREPKLDARGAASPAHAAGPAFARHSVEVQPTARLGKVVEGSCVAKLHRRKHEIMDSDKAHTLPIFVRFLSALESESTRFSPIGP